MSDIHQIVKDKLNEIVDLLVREVVEKAQTDLFENRIVQGIKAAEIAGNGSLSQNDFELLDVKQTAQLLKVKERTIYEWVRTNKIPYKKIGDLLRFNKSEIFKWIEES
ncbi:MAG TPA: helix-turn-helix domain-containing protein [Pyrinomonadaceae bacterium]|nr:helix-turn-helix domain-containing protein [Pyrinomonadaceae bacterium]